MLRGWPLEWGSLRYPEESWSYQGKSSGAKWPAEVKSVVKSELSRVFTTMQIYTVGELTSIHYGILFGIIENSIMSVIRTRNQVYSEKKLKINEYAKQFPKANNEEKLRYLKEQYNKSSIKTQLTGMGPRMKKKYLRVHAYYLKNDPTVVDVILAKYRNAKPHENILRRGLEYLLKETDEKVKVSCFT